MTSLRPHRIELLWLSILAVIACESGALLVGNALSAFGTTAFIRGMEILLLVLILNRYEHGLESAGLCKARLCNGLKSGFIISACFGFSAGMIGGALYLAGINPLTLIQVPLPLAPMDRALFFIAGAVISPVAEELFFRGILYGTLRRLGLFPAMVLSSLIFAFFHYSPSSLPVVQLIGGLVFALSFELSKSLAAPVIIHVLGNLTLFSISLFFPFG